MTTTKQSWLKRSLAVLLAVMMVMSMGVANVFAAVESTTKTATLIEVTVTETTESGATIHIKNNQDYGMNQLGFYKVLKKSEPGFDNAEALITSFGSITDSTTIMAASIPEFLNGPSGAAQTEATKTVSDLEAGTEYVVYVAIGDYYAMATSNDYSGCSFAAVEFSTKTATLIEVTVTETTESGATIHIKNNQDYGMNQLGFYKVLKKSEPGFDNAEALITSFGSITDSTTIMAASIPEFLNGPSGAAQTEATKTVSDLEAGTEYVVYVAIGDYYAMATSNDYSGCSFAAVEFSTKTSGGGETPTPPDQENAVVELSYQESGKEGITKVSYEKFEDATVALNALDDCSNITLTLLKDTTIQPTKAYGYAAVIQKSCTLDLNGKVLTAYSDIVGSLTGGLLVEGNVHFVLTDSSEDHTGMILSKSGPASMITGLEIGSGFDEEVYESLPGTITFEMNGAVVKNSNYDQSKATKGCLSMSSDCTSAVLNDSVVYGAVTANCASLTLNDSRIEASTENQQVLTFRGKLIMDGSTITNTYDGSAESHTVSYYQGANETVNVGTILELTNSTISAGSGTALNLGMNQKIKYTVELNNGAHVISDSGIGIYLASESVGPSWYDEENPSPHAAIQLSAGSVVSGTSAIEVAVDTKHYKLSDVTKVIKVEMDDGAFLGYDNVPALPNTSVMTYPTGMVLDVDPSNEEGFEGYYTLKNTSEMNQVKDGITFGYQYLATLNAAIEGTQSLYNAGNDDGTYDTLLWNTFAEAYEEAVALCGSDEIAANLNANQNEIDYREQQLSATALALRESLDAVDLSSLANGTYSIEIQMMHSSDNGNFSMANGAVERTAVLTIKDDEQTLAIDFKPMELGPINGHLLKFWVYNASAPNEAKLFNESYIQDDYVVHSNYYNQDGVNDPVYDDNGTYPGRITFKLPYFNSTDGYNKIYGRVSVDAMASNQNVIILLQYHTLKAIEVQPTLSLSTYELSMMVGDAETVTATLKGEVSEGYTVTGWSSDNESIATVDNGTIKAVGEGTATITVTASNGTDSISKTIAVTVAPEGSEAVKVEKVETSGNTETATLSGSFLTSSGAEGIAVNGNTVTIDAKSDGSNITSSKVVIPQETAQALAGKTVVVETSTGSISLNSTLLAQIAGVENGVTLSISKASTPVGLGTFSSAYEISLVDANGDAVEFGEGQATVTVTSEETVNYAYCIDNGQRTERVATSTSGNSVSFTVSHFSLWALSDREYEVGGSASSSFFLEDGNYYVDIALWKSDSNEASMGNVAFKNNDKALVTVKDGKITKVQIGTNPVDIDPYHSAIISFELADGTKVKIEAKGDLTTIPANKDYTYIKLVSFNLPDSAQPDIKDAVTYVPVNFYVPDTPMDAAVGETLTALLRFTWSTATKTDDTSLQVDDTTAAGDSPITGEEIVDVNLVDEATGIKLETNSGILSDKAVLSVEKLTQGADYDIAMKAMNGVDGSWNLYKIVALVDGVETAPLGSVVLYIPCGAEGMTLYRVNADGTKTLVRGEVQDGYYVVRTTSLGLFAMVSEAAGTPGGTQDGNQNSNTTSPQTGDSSNVAVYALLTLAAAGMMGVTLVTRKRKAEEK